MMLTRQLPLVRLLPDRRSSSKIVYITGLFILLNWAEAFFPAGIRIVAVSIQTATFLSIQVTLLAEWWRGKVAMFTALVIFPMYLLVKFFPRIALLVFCALVAVIGFPSGSLRITGQHRAYKSLPVPRRGAVKAKIFTSLIEMLSFGWKAERVPHKKNSYDTWKKSFVSEPVYLRNASSAPSPSTVAEESEEEEIIPEADVSLNRKTESLLPASVSTLAQKREEEKIIPEADSEVPVELDIIIEKQGYMKECVLYCALFPCDYEFSRDTLVWSWTAAGLIKSEQNGDVGAVAIRCFERLMQLKYILHSGYDHLRDQMMYKLGNDKTEFLNKHSLGVQHRNGLDSETDVEKIQHLSLIFEGIDKINFDILRNSRHLKTLLLHQCSGSGLENLLHDVLLELKSLTILDLSCTEIVELPSSLEFLKGLKYLDLSETPIRRLPEWTDSLCNLETLILVGCLNLCGLPKCMYKMIKLQHLVLDIARQLQSMPIGMGKLTNLQTLSAFLVGKKDGNRITQLRNMNKLKGSLSILKLENILNKDEARDARLHEKLHLTKLDFVWSNLQDAKITSEEEILEHLQPHFGLQELKIVSYGGGSLPSWISDPSFTQITSITLYGCRYCERLPSLGELPSLKILNIVDMDELVVIDRLFYQQQANQRQNAFPRLEKLSFDGMSNLEIWTGIEEGHFPCLQLLMIGFCPRLTALPSLSYLNSLLHLEICDCPKLPCLPEGRLPSSLKCLMMKDCPKLKERCYSEQGEDWAKVMSVPTLYIDNQKISSNL